eukprot:TRINITY_DN1491_c1_g1_i1.p1 TRINITY_DN1491_c1_g1~~TRINITY_DN1491_c1_g1_i1.p1  ORF type:complete len:500 (-),score=82.25 TRINITY_DN1491_c1_g1_i1:129-1577(-)
MGLFSSQKALFLLVFGCFSAVFSAPASDETCLFCLDLIHSLGTNLHSSHPQRVFEPKSREKCAISCRYARHGVENIDLWAWETLRMSEKQHFEQFPPIWAEITPENTPKAPLNWSHACDLLCERLSAPAESSKTPCHDAGFCEISPHIASFFAPIAEKKTKNAEKNTEIGSRNAEIGSKNADLASKNTEIGSKSGENARKMAKTAQKAVKLAVLHGLGQSFGELEGFVQALREQLPEGSIVRNFEIGTGSQASLFLPISSQARFLCAQIRSEPSFSAGFSLLAFGHAAIIARIAFSDLGKTAEIGEKMAEKPPKNGENGWKMRENGREIGENGRKMAENGKFCARMPKLDGFFAVGAPENGIYSAIFGENDGIDPHWTTSISEYIFPLKTGENGAKTPQNSLFSALKAHPGALKNAEKVVLVGNSAGKFAEINGLENGSAVEAGIINCEPQNQWILDAECQKLAKLIISHSNSETESVHSEL